MTAAAFKATYSNWKVVKTRGVVQVEFEVPLAQHDIAYQALGGMPDPAKERWFAIAALKPEVANERMVVPTEAKNTPTPETTPRPLEPGGGVKKGWDELPNSQQAALSCRRIAFRRWLASLSPNGPVVIIGEDDEDPEAVATADAKLKVELGITSKTQLDKEAEHSDNWRQFYGEFKSWLHAPEYVDA